MFPVISMDVRYKKTWNFLFFYYYVLHSTIIFSYLCYDKLLVLAYIMRNIVLYRLTFAIGILMAVNLAKAQKPAIDLLPSSHQYMHPAAILDTSSVNDTLIHIVPFISPDTVNTDSLKVKKEKKRQFQFGLNLDSILHKGEVRKNQVGSRSGLFPLIMKNLNPIKLFIHITALN